MLLGDYKMIYLTGDTHGNIDISKLNNKNFPEGKNLTKDDYLIVLGDFGLVWDNSPQELYLRNWLDEKPWTTLFVDGNHENFELLNEFPLTTVKGAKAHKVSKSIYHILRGEILNIDDKKLFVFGGANSHDKAYRKEGKTWWKEEMPSMNEMNHGIDTLEKVDYDVDFVLTHTASSDVTKLLIAHNETDELERFFSFISKELKPNFKWYFGHYHKDISLLDGKFNCLYKNIIRIL